MQQCTAVQTAVCKSLQSVGLNPRKEHQIENAIAIQLRSSGPEFVLKRLSDLSDWRKMHMTGDTLYHPDWHAFKVKQGHCCPSDPIGANLWGLSDKAFFSALGACRMAVELVIPTEKQLTKWIEGVRCENKSSDYHVMAKCPDKWLDELEEKLQQKWSGRHWFDIRDISCTSISGSGKTMNVGFEKDRVHPKALSLLSAYGFSVSTAPLFIWQFFKDIDLPHRLAEGSDCPDELIDSLSEVINAKKSSYQLEDEALMGSSFLSDEEQLASKKYRNFSMGFMHSVGNIGFIQKPGGKLRTVANPNRLVEYANVPLGEALCDVYYKYTPEVFVLNQSDGWAWAQEKLREGVSLSSFDMTAASDRLDYAKFLHHYFKKAYEGNDHPLLQRSLELFEDTSGSNWSIPGHVADLCGISCGEIGWSVGQPLGLRPSFPTLTIMNSTFAKNAVYAVDGKYSRGHYACVGDDLIIETKYADAYMEAVAAYNGKINNDKSMQSDRYAEFCSHLVTRSTVYPLKPRFLLDLDGSLSNVDKFTTKGLHPVVPKWCVEIHNRLAQNHLDGFNTIKYYATANPLPLEQRIGVNTLIEVIKPASRDAEHVTLQSVYLRALEERERQGSMPPIEEMSSSYASHAYAGFGGPLGRPKVVTKRQSQPSGYGFGTLGEVSTDTSTSVEVPVKKEWDYRSARYVRPASEISQAKKVLRTIEATEVEVVGPLIESSTVVKGVKTSVLVDTSSETPEVSVRHTDERTGVHTPSRPITDAERELDRLYSQIRFKENDYSDDFSL